MHACKLANLKFGENVVVCWWPVGLLTAAVAKPLAPKGYRVDIFDNKLQMAKDMGAATFNFKTGDDLVKAFDGETSVVLECSGAKQCIYTGVKITPVSCQLEVWRKRCCVWGWPVGLLTAACCQNHWRQNIMVVDILITNCKWQKIWCATHTFNFKTGDDLVKAFDGIEPSVVLECSGAKQCIYTGVKILKAGGRFVQVGNAGGDVNFPIADFSTRELTLYGSFRYGYGDYQTSIDILDKTTSTAKKTHQSILSC